MFDDALSVISGFDVEKNLVESGFPEFNGE